MPPCLVVLAFALAWDAQGLVPLLSTWPSYSGPAAVGEDPLWTSHSWLLWNELFSPLLERLG